MGDEKKIINTYPVRYAVSCYIEKILGYCHEDYNYSNINCLLETGHKKFIKNVACYPNKLQIQDFSYLRCVFKKEEILNIILLVATSKAKTQLTYLASSLYEIIKHID